MRTKAERRNYENKELEHRINICKDIRLWDADTIEYIKRKRDVPHSLGSNWWNAYETKAMNNKKERLKEKNKLRKENFELEN